MKTVTVIIPFYKNTLWLVEALTTVHNQTYGSIEVILINDGSTEDLSDIISTWPQLKLITIPNSGAAVARNTGIAAATGEYIAFLDSDDLWVHDKLEKQIHFMEKNGFVWSHTDYLRFDDASKSERYVHCSISGNIFPLCLVWNPIATPCIIVKRSVLTENNLGFAVDKAAGEDTHLWRELGKRYTLGYMPEALTKVRIHGRNTAFSARPQLKERASLIPEVKANKNAFASKFTYYYLLAILQYCKFSYHVLTSIHKRLRLDKSDFLFKIFFGIAYVNFRMLRKTTA